MRGDGVILPSVPESFGSGLMRPGVGSAEGAAECAAASSEPADAGALETWLLGKLGLLEGDGLLGALLWDALALDAALDEPLDEALGGGLEGALELFEECCARTNAGESRSTATTALVSRITYLLATACDFSVLRHLDSTDCLKGSAKQCKRA
jgi:hypothetical protein